MPSAAGWASHPDGKRPALLHVEREHGVPREFHGLAQVEVPRRGVVDVIDCRTFPRSPQLGGSCYYDLPWRLPG